MLTNCWFSVDVALLHRRPQHVLLNPLPTCEAPRPTIHLAFFFFTSTSLQASDDMLSEATRAVEDMEGRLFESSRKAQEAEAAWEVEREILSQSNESAQVRKGVSKPLLALVLCCSREGSHCCCRPYRCRLVCVLACSGCV